MNVPPALPGTYVNEMIAREECCVAWAHGPDPTIPLFAHKESRKIVEDNMSFWRVVNEHVKFHGPFTRIKLFKNGSQTLYSKTKGDVDGATQYRAILRSQTGVRKWEKVDRSNFKVSSRKRIHLVANDAARGIPGDITNLRKPRSLWKYYKQGTVLR